MCGQIWSLGLLEVLTRNRQSAVELSRRTIRTRAQSLGMFTIPPRKRLSVTNRLAIRARRVTRTRIIIVIIVIIINTQIAFKTHPCNIHTKEREKDIAYHRVYFFLFSRVLFHHHSKRLFLSCCLSNARFRIILHKHTSHARIYNCSPSRRIVLCSKI